MKWIDPIVLLGAAACAALVCVTSTAVSAGGFDDVAGPGTSYWKVARLQARSEEGVSAFVVTIEGGEIVVASRCLTAHYPVQSDKGTVTVSRPWSELRRCGTRTAAAFGSALRRSKSADESSGTLTFHDREGVATARLVRFVPAGLEFRRWQITSYFDGSKMVAPTHIVRGQDWGWPRVTFAEGALEGSPGCGGLFGRYNLLGERIEIKNVGWILAGECLKELEAQNVPVCKALSGNRIARRSGAQFELLDDDGSVRVILSPEDTPSPTNTGVKSPT
jgi:hypothetical protein